MKLLDSFVWIGYFRGSGKGAKVKSYVGSTEPLYTPSIYLTEVQVFEGERDPTDTLRFIIVYLDEKIALLADMEQNMALYG